MQLFIHIYIADENLNKEDIFSTSVMESKAVLCYVCVYLPIPSIYTYRGRILLYWIHTYK